MATKPEDTKKSKSRKLWFNLLMTMVFLTTIAIAISKALEWKHWLSPPATPALGKSGIIDHTGYVFWDNDKEWKPILTEDNKDLVFSIDIPGNPTRADFDAAWAQLKARFVYKNGSRSEEHPLKQLTALHERVPAIEIKGTPGKYRRIWLIADQVAQKKK